MVRFDPSLGTARATMASADSSLFVVTTVCRPRERPPRVSTLSFFPYRFLIYPTSFRIGIGFRVQGHTHPLAWPCMRFLFVTPGICRWLPSPYSSRSTSCLKLGLGPISPTTGLAPARTAHMSRAHKKWRSETAILLASVLKPSEHTSLQSFG